MKALLITQCSDGMMWYRNHINKIVPLIKDSESSTEYLSREPAGYSNIVLKKDAVVVDVPANLINYLPPKDVS